MGRGERCVTRSPPRSCKIDFCRCLDPSFSSIEQNVKRNNKVHLSLAKLEIDSTRESVQGGIFETCHRRISCFGHSSRRVGSGKGKSVGHSTRKRRKKECSLDHERCSNGSFPPFSPCANIVFLYFPQMCLCVRVFAARSQRSENPTYLSLDENGRREKGETEKEREGTFMEYVVSTLSGMARGKYRKRRKVEAKLYLLPRQFFGKDEKEKEEKKVMSLPMCVGAPRLSPARARSYCKNRGDKVEN